jgi:4-hydroxybenzoate polyprenyltransferase
MTPESRHEGIRGPLAYLLLLRPKQWIKNFFVFAALLFGKKFTEPEAILHSLGAFAVFCALASVVYVVNDTCDREADRKHPKKRLRPLASGAVSVSTAVCLAVLFLVGGLVGAWLLGTGVLIVVGIYFVMNLAYSLRLKHVVILDVLLVAIGFVLRVLAGASAVDVTPSAWLLLCTLLLSLFLALTKRRHELVLLEGEAANARAILDEYTPTLLDQMVSVVTASTTMSYALYAIEPTTQDAFPGLIYTIPLVLWGIFRYLYLVYRKKEGGDPTELLLADRHLMFIVVIWIAIVTSTAALA